MKTAQKISIFFILTLALTFFTGCSKKEVINPLPLMTTTDASIITETTFKSGGTITSDAGSAITARGVCWSTSVDPTISNDKTSDGTGTGTFVSTITVLSSGTYYVRAYATNSAGTNYGNSITVKTLPPATTITDNDGNTYKTVNIGTQTWMAENLKTTKYRTGEDISYVVLDSIWKKAPFGAYCNYNNDPANAPKYGRLYNWIAVNETRKIAPAGWHIATSEEWTILINYLGGENGAGAKLKEIGFTALLGGSRDSFGIFGTIGNNGYWWSATEHDSTTSDIWYLNNTDNSALNSYKLKTSGYSVRCVKDAK